MSRVSNDITMWDTTYYHVVPSHDSVIEWYKGSGLRPYLEMLSPAEKSEFLSDLLAVIKREYPVQADDRVILKMPRLFFTAGNKTGSHQSFYVSSFRKRQPYGCLFILSAVT